MSNKPNWSKYAPHNKKHSAVADRHKTVKKVSQKKVSNKPNRLEFSPHRPKAGYTAADTKQNETNGQTTTDYNSANFTIST